ncbi:cadherin-13-like isoform X2 [Acipenser ruthenus]|uniref:cadherin-13-like isoform X2 n=1 Tax=Acipenser ruthenus TaxID=7906 RepID=UPI0027427CF4|nr:cadherin-13-like isoform X2 [Acipenser ruthenus]
MEHKIQILLACLVSQVLLVAVAEDVECVPGFQKKSYELEYQSGFRKEESILKVNFDDCHGNENVNFEVSHPAFIVDEDGSVVPLRDVTDSGSTLFIHGRTAFADDMVEIKIHGAPERRPQTLKEILGLGQSPAFMRTKRSLLAPPMFVPENQRAPFPKSIGKMQVETTDLSGKTLEGPVDVEVAIIDQNDNRPVFKGGPHVGEILEGSPTGTTVMRMTAYDADDPNTDNAVLRYNIVKQTPDKPSPNMFYIDPEKGDIVTVVSPALLDRESMPSHKYELEIVAKDMAGSDVGLTGTATATITITDKNDHAPEFTKPLFQATVNEGVTGVIVNLTVEDKDDPTTGGWRAVYSIINGNPGQSFEMNTNAQNNQGMLTVVKPLDYEISAFHTLLIKVENEDLLVPDVAYGPSSTATVQVTVVDVNEGPIFYPDPMRVTRRENIPIGSAVATLNATDPDTLQHQTVKFAVLKDPAGWLSVHPVKGTVNTTAILDRESTYVKDNTYTAVFMATDNGSPPATGTGTLVITLEDGNDHAPSLYPSVARVCEDSKDLSVVLLGGRDEDISPNADPFKFELGKQAGLEKTWKITKVNNTHAQVSLLHNLKRANYNLPIIVTDSGMPPLPNSTEIKVQVCTCKKNKMDCSAANSLHMSLAVLICFSFITLLCL